MSPLLSMCLTLSHLSLVFPEFSVHLLIWCLTSKLDHFLHMCRNTWFCSLLWKPIFLWRWTRKKTHRKNRWRDSMRGFTRLASLFQLPSSGSHSLWLSYDWLWLADHRSSSPRHRLMSLCVVGNHDYVQGSRFDTTDGLFLAFLVLFLLLFTAVD